MYCFKNLLKKDYSVLEDNKYYKEYKLNPNNLDRWQLRNSIYRKWREDDCPCLCIDRYDENTLEVQEYKKKHKHYKKEYFKRYLIFLKDKSKTIKYHSKKRDYYYILEDLIRLVDINEGSLKNLDIKKKSTIKYYNIIEQKFNVCLPHYYLQDLHKKNKDKSLKRIQRVIDSITYEYNKQEKILELLNTKYTELFSRLEKYIPNLIKQVNNYISIYTKKK